MKTYKKTAPTKSLIVRTEKTDGETIEMKIERVVNNGEPIKDGAPIVYTERKDGVRAETNVRTDRWEVAADAMDAVAKAEVAKRDKRQSDHLKVVKKEIEDNSGAEPTQGTN